MDLFLDGSDLIGSAATERLNKLQGVPAPQAIRRLEPRVIPPKHTAKTNLRRTERGIKHMPHGHFAVALKTKCKFVLCLGSPVVDLDC